MIIEFSGVPGGGKTTVATRLEKETEYKRIQVSGKRELLLLNSTACLKRPIWSFILFLHICKHSPTLAVFWYKFTNLFLLANAKYEKAKHMKMGVIDQGYVQSLISISEKPLTKKELKELTSHMPRTDATILFTVSPEVSLRNAEGRDYIIRRTKGERAFRDRLSVMRANAGLLQENSSYIEGLISVPVEGTEDQVYAQITSTLYEL